MANHVDEFTNIYETCAWGYNNNPHYKGSSGAGSSIELNAKTYVPFLRKFIKENNIKSIVDIGCGDWRCGQLIYMGLNVEYTGIDVYEPLIKYNESQWPHYNWLCMNVQKERADLPVGDLLVIKDVIQHWYLPEITEFMDYITTCDKYKYILITNCSHQYADNLEIFPNDISRFRPLTVNFLPLKKYGGKIVYTFDRKEVSLITLCDEAGAKVGSD
jgi:hypothetical protein